MKGKIKFVDQKTGQWGFIVREDNGDDIHFTTKSFLTDPPWFEDRDAAVEFDIRDVQPRPFAINIRPIDQTLKMPLVQPGQKFSSWAAVPLHAFIHRDGLTYSSVYEALARVALSEKWFFGQPEPQNDDRYPILRNYLAYTFHRLHATNGIAMKDVADNGGKAILWAAFNTGLVDALYDPIYVLFTRNTYRLQPPWRFYDFCVPGKGSSGKQLTAVFDPLPEPAKYFHSNFDMVLDTDRDIHVDYEHVIIDGIARDRFPNEFLQANLPRQFVWEDCAAKSISERFDFLRRLSTAVQGDTRCTRAIKNRLEDAKTLAEKRTRWNFKTAIPQYHPRFNSMSLLLLTGSPKLCHG